MMMACRWRVVGQFVPPYNNEAPDWASEATPIGWRDYPSHTRLQAPGCYAYQVDTRAGTTVIVFLAKGPRVRV